MRNNVLTKGFQGNGKEFQASNHDLNSASVERQQPYFVFDVYLVCIVLQPRVQVER